MEQQVLDAILQAAGGNIPIAAIAFILWRENQRLQNEFRAELKNQLTLTQKALRVVSKDDDHAA